MTVESELQERILPDGLLSSIRGLRRRILKLKLRQRVSGLAPNRPVRRNDGLQRIEVVVINLDSRPDRLTNFSREMKNLGIEKWTRISATNGMREFPDLGPFYAGSLGCTLSHIQALETEFSSKEAILVCEDDLEFHANSNIVSQLISEFLDEDRYDVLALSGRPRGASLNVSENLKVVDGLVGRAAYLVKPHMVPILKEAFWSGVPMLKKLKRKGKGDIRWQKLQKKHNFVYPRILVAQQSAGFSDIESKELGPR